MIGPGRDGRGDHDAGAPSVVVWHAAVAPGRPDPRVAIVAHELDVDPVTVRFAEGYNGRPELRVTYADRAASHERGAIVDVNVSHSHTTMLVAVARGIAVGVDVERHRPRSLERLATRVFSDEELAAWRAEADPLVAFYRRWARKEAVLKAEGRGLSSLRAASATPAPPGWSVTDLDVRAGWSAAVAAPCENLTVSLRRWPPVAPVQSEP